MGFVMLSVLVLIVIIFLRSIRIIIKTIKTRLFPSPHLPPGSLGWPLIGETIDFIRAGLEGKPEKFITKRMRKHDSRAFKTSLLGEPYIVFCGPAGHKFLFSNENKLLNARWPSSVRKLLKSSLINVVGDESKWMRRMLMTFLNPDALKTYTESIDRATQEHIRRHWEDTSGRFLSEMEIVHNILLLLFAGHDTSRSAITLLMKYLGEMPEVYAKVLKEQIDIVKSKEAGELLQWEDVQKMKCSWNVASEVIKLSPPVSGAFREALVDFTYQGYTIPKGWKLYLSTGSTHKDPALFPNPEGFDASRFAEGPTPYSYVPFGGGPRMCLGHEFARLEILVFLHNIVRIFKWDVLIPNEKFGYEPKLAPSQGLPIHLQPHQS